MSDLCVVCRQDLKRAAAMKPVELKAIRGVLGHRSGLRRPLSQADFARLLGISPRGLRNYEQGVRLIPAPVAKEARRLKEASLHGDNGRNDRGGA
jgi:DNA-binding transcriptional regulator YiaG